MGIEVVIHSPGVGAHLVSQPAGSDLKLITCPARPYLGRNVLQLSSLPLNVGYFRWPQTLISQFYKYLRHGAGWLLCTTIEVEIFGMSSLIQADGKPAFSAHTKDPFDPRNRPDFAVMTVGTFYLSDLPIELIRNSQCGIADPSRPGIDRSKGFFGLSCASQIARPRLAAL